MEKIKITFLGTSGSVPQKNKNSSSTAITFEGNNILFDAPEGTQRQLMISDLSLMKINNVFISHMHADHFLGLFGWIATQTLNQRKEKLTIFSPKGGKEKISKILKEIIKPCFPIEFKELKKGLMLKEKDFEIKAFPLKHEISCYGFVFKEKDKKGEFDRKKAEKLGIPPGPLYSKLVEGKTISINGKKFTKKDVLDYSKKRIGRKIVIIPDTRPIRESIVNAKNADILIHESTFLEDQKANAIEGFHSTAKEAAQIAKKAMVKKLFLIHYSARTSNEKLFEEEAKKVFTNSFSVKDFDVIEV
ncbi:MAG: ribonuclease Z [Candidatus ainarchaeum sp.]|nr:ribonuclease Z [Candidatus ainarchaeum sp.]